MNVRLTHYSALTVTILAATFLIGASFASAAEYSMKAPRTSVAPGETFLVDVFIRTQGEQINAFEGSIEFDTTSLELVETRDGNSLVSMWISSPSQKSPGVVSFSGITPGGYRGDSGRLFSMLFRAKEVTDGSLTFTELNALKNDGNGTPASVSGTAFRYVISADIPKQETTLPADITPPEPFTVELIQSQDAFEGKSMVAFATQDKGAGVAYYKVCEGLFSVCTTSVSPYELHGQSADRLLRVVAYDHSKNSRTAFLLTPRALIRYSLFSLATLLFVVGASVFYARRKKGKA